MRISAYLKRSTGARSVYSLRPSSEPEKLVSKSNNSSPGSTLTTLPRSNVSRANYPLIALPDLTPCTPAPFSKAGELPAYDEPAGDYQCGLGFVRKFASG